MNGRPAEILLVEDDLIDIKLIKKAFSQLNLDINLHIVNNGEEALRFLRKSAESVAAPSIDLILLDINMPRMSGREFLKELKNDPALRHKVAIVFTSSEDARDINSCYDLGANGYMCKPIAPADFNRALLSLHDFWCVTASLAH